MKINIHEKINTRKIWQLIATAVRLFSIGARLYHLGLEYHY